ncbi:hypothetical protein BX616_009056 [Lobosporangium transversale]|nr:hypothetical protein BX616_009056 [Lobosporangium transversale]
MDEYQMFEQRGVQELVRVSFDEDGLPCIFLHNIEFVFPNVKTISSYGMRIPYVTDMFHIPVLDIESGNSELEWSRDATAARIAAAAASVPYVNTVHTNPIPGILDLNLDIDSKTDNSHPAETGNLDIEDFFDMVESEASVNDEEAEREEEEEEKPLSKRLRSPSLITDSTRGPSLVSVSVTPSITTTEGSSLTMISPRTVQSITLEPIPENGFYTRELITAPNQTPRNPSFVTSPLATTLDPIATYPLSAPNESQSGLLPPPSYEPVDTGLFQLRALHEVHRIPVTAIDDPAERHLVFDRIEIIKRISRTILTQKYGAESCAHPPLFVLLPEYPLQWISQDILHNKMRLYFLCDCCEHEIYDDDNTYRRPGQMRYKRNVHIDESKGFEIRIDQSPDQMLIIKFGHYILSLLRMLQYGVSLDEIFVPAAFDRMVSPNTGTAAIAATAKRETNPELFIKLKQSVEKSIAFMEALLGDDYDEEAAEAIHRLDTNDFRLLDAIVKRPPYTQPWDTVCSTHTALYSSTPKGTSMMPLNPDIAACGTHIKGSGLYQVLGVDGQVHWACKKYYTRHHKDLDQIFSKKLELLQTTFDPYTRSSVFVGISESHLNTRMVTVSQIRALLRIDITIDWDFHMSQVKTLADLLRQEATTVSTIAIRLSKQVSPLTWRKHLPALGGNEQQPISAIVGLMKNRKIRHVILEGNIDLMSVPNISTMDFSNLDILNIMKIGNRGLAYNGSSSSSIHSNENSDSSSIISSTIRNTLHETYIPELLSFMQAFSLLTELSLGFNDAIPGHIRILQACISSQRRLKRLDLFRVLGPKLNTDALNDGYHGEASVNCKLELSANISTSRVVRLFLAECKTTTEGKVRLLEALEDFLTDEGSHLEDLELRFVGFNDKHAHALELGTRPLSGSHQCRLRRLVIHGNGLEYGGALALRRVLGRATLPSKLDQEPFTDNNVFPSTAAPSPASLHSYRLDSLSFGVILEEPTLIHLELCSIDSLKDPDWANLLSELTLQRVITLDLQGVGFGDRAMAVLAASVSAEKALSPPSPPLSPMDVASAFMPAPSSLGASLEPPLAGSSSIPLHLQALRLSCSALSSSGVIYLKDFLSRLEHLSTLSLHGFRRVPSEDWIDIMDSVGFQWLEVIEIVSFSFDDNCARYLGERIRARNNMSENSVTVDRFGEVSESTPPAHNTAGTAENNASASASPSFTSASASTSGSGNRRKDSFSSRLFNTLTPSSGLPATTISTISFKQKPKDKDMGKDAVLSLDSPTVSVIPCLNSFQKYLEIDLRYTDVSAKGLSILRRQTIDQAKKVVVRARDGENEDIYVNDIDKDEQTQLPAKPRDGSKADGRGKHMDEEKTSISPLPTSKPYYAGYIGSGGALAGAFIHSSSGSGMRRGGKDRETRGNINGNSNVNCLPQNQQPKTSTLMKLKNVFKK